MDDPRIIVIGGGLAGIAAAVKLMQNDVKPLVVERRPFLGGRAFSFQDRETGEHIDNGQHVILGACSAYLELLDQLGIPEAIDLEKRLNVPVVIQEQMEPLRAGTLLGNASALLRYRHLSRRERFSVARCMLRMKLMRFAIDAPAELRATSLDDWLAQHGQSMRVRQRFWALFAVPVFNSALDDIAAYDAIVFIRLALLGVASKSALGLPRSGLSSIADAAERHLRDRGGKVIAGESVKQIIVSDQRVKGLTLQSGQSLYARAVVIALEARDLARILPKQLRNMDFFAPLAKIQTSSIVGVNIWYDAPVMKGKYRAFLGGKLQWVFNLSKIRGSNAAHQHLAVSLSDAQEWMDMNKQSITDCILAEMRRAFPAAQRHKVLKSTVVKTSHATIKIAPGSHHTRLSHHSPIRGMFLAGDWTDTGLPASMEGAVRSGHIAANAALKEL